MLHRDAKRSTRVVVNESGHAPRHTGQCLWSSCLAWLVILANAGCARDAREPPDAAPASPPSASAPLPVPSSAPAPSPSPAPSRVTSDWCSEGLEALAEDACFVVPEGAPRRKRTLLIYLHGVVAPTGHTQSIVQQIVATSARAHGVVALLPRGRRGIGPGATKDWWAWPTTAAAHARYAKEMIASWRAWRDELALRTGGPFERTYLAGSSNGAYFVTVLAMNGEIEVDGFGAMSGGTRGSRTKATTLAARRSPFYVGYGTQDDANKDPIALGELLAEAQWPHMVAAHAVGHGARAIYLDEAFAFWDAD